MDDAPCRVGVAEASSSGLALLKLLQPTGRGVNDGPNGDGETTAAGVEAASPRWQLNEWLVEAVLALVESCVRWMEVEGRVEALCCELKTPSCHKKSERRNFLKTLRGWKEYDDIAERGWRWCEAHITLLSTDESAWCHKTFHDAVTVTDWWWRPHVVSATDSLYAQDVSAATARQLFNDVLASVNVPSGEDVSETELKVASVFLETLYASSPFLFGHRIAAGEGVLRRLFMAKAAALLHQAHAMSCLAFLKHVVRPCVPDTKKVRAELSQNKDHKLLWVSREGFLLAWKSLVSAITAVQVVAAHFNEPCNELRRRIRWALFGIRDAVNEGSPPPCSGATTFFVHPFAEPSENPWRITHGVGFVATGKIREGTVVLRERPLLFAEVPRPPPAEPNAQNSELSTVTAAALELFQRGGVAHMDDTVIAQVVENVQSGALFGQATQSVDMWSALHLLAAMPEAEDKSLSAGDGFARDIAALMRSWNERAIALRPVEDFRIRQSEPPRQNKALYPFGSLLNHSCSPNALRLFCNSEDTNSVCGGDVLCVVALRDIEPGEEITVTYLMSPLLSRSEKRLWNGFFCRCVFCQSHSALLEGVVCPACQQLVYNDDDEEEGGSNNNHDGGGDSSRTAHGTSFTGIFDAAERRVTPHAHASDCTLAERSNYKDLAGQIAKRFKKVFCTIHRKFYDNSGTGAACEDADCAQDEHENIKRGKENEQHARRAEKAMHQLMNLDLCARGLPATHYRRLQARLQCLAISLNVDTTPHDSARLVELCKDVLNDMERLLPRNYPLLTGIRLHYALARSRHLIAAPDVDDCGGNGHLADCCGCVHEQQEMLRLPFVRDVVIRECVARSFQEYYVCSGWRLAKANDREILQSFLEHYAMELLVCGIDSVSHLNMVSLMCDTTQNDDAEMCV